MQLPRGTFREIRKKIRASDLLNEIETTRFSGICTISYGTTTGTFVFRSGSCILAKMKDSQADAAWQILREINDKEVDAAFSSLDDAQIGLALEFNKFSKITGTGIKAHTHPSPSQLSVHLPPAKKTAIRHHLVIPTETPDDPHPHSVSNPPPVRSTQDAPGTGSSGVRTEKQKNAKTIITGHHEARDIKSAEEDNSRKDPSCQESGSFEKDIETIGEMDLDNMSEKIRTDCKTIVRQLHLEHLMEH